MKTKGFAVTTAIIAAMDIICVAICAWQTAYLISFQDIFAAEHPSYVSHSWILLTLLLVLAALTCGQAVMSRKNRESPVLCCTVSVLMIVLEVLALRAAADQHYHMGMLISDYQIQAPFDGGWLLLLLVVALIAATITQLLIVSLSALSRHTGM